jgi:4-hydroxymandelate oxidase
VSNPGGDALHCLDDIERAAFAVLPPEVRDFFAGGSGGESTVAANRAAFDSVYVIPRVLRDVSAGTTTSALLGRPVSMPIATAPIAFQKLLHEDGELAVARAAKVAGIPYTVSTMSSVRLEEISAIGGSTWFQLYWMREPKRSLELVRRAEAAGCTAILLTVDLPWMGRRLRDVRNQFALPEHVVPANLDHGNGTAAHNTGSGGSAVATHAGQAISAALTWSDVDTLRSASRLPLVLKGILAPEDAERAVDHGVDAIVVSNHGGRQLDGAVPSIAVLEAICQAVGGRCEILLDSGVRSGVDVLKALALGASGVLLGRPLMWGLAVDGEDGVRRVLDLLAADLRDALGLAGCASVAEARELRTFTSTF